MLNHVGPVSFIVGDLHQWNSRMQHPVYSMLQRKAWYYPGQEAGLTRKLKLNCMNKTMHLEKLHVVRISEVAIHITVQGCWKTTPVKSRTRPKATLPPPVTGTKDDRRALGDLYTRTAMTMSWWSLITAMLLLIEAGYSYRTSSITPQASLSVVVGKVHRSLIHDMLLCIINTQPSNYDADIFITKYFITRGFSCDCYATPRVTFSLSWL